MKTNVSYTVRATQRIDALYQDGGIAQAKGTTIYLDYTTESGGWPQWGTDMPRSTPYRSAAEALATARKADRAPWWNRPDMNTLKAIRLTNSTDFSFEDVD